MRKLSVDEGTWSELSRLLDAALEQPAPRREEWIDTLAPCFDALKPRLRDLLSRCAVAETADFLNTLPKVGSTAPESPLSPVDRPGDEIGPYRLIREIGSGGMGAVWLAERVDRLINRPVALKLPHGGDRKSVV